MQQSFFEGTEKKVELVVSAAGPDLRALGEARWNAIVEACGAEVLSSMRGEACDAYLLSESSLFVFARKFVMITCGRTRLVDAVAAFLEQVPASEVRLLVFERKNEVFPHRQPTSFYEDASRLNEMVPGHALRFGNEYENHVHLYHHGKAAAEEGEDVTFEVLMYDLDGDPIDRIDAMRGLFPGFRVEDHVFKPSGYSLNALSGEHYGTIHVTPQQHGSYASFETNRPCREDLSSLVGRVIEVFRPRAFDVVLFDQGDQPFSPPSDYVLRTRVVETLPFGYRVRFLSHALPPAEERAFPIPIQSGVSTEDLR